MKFYDYEEVQRQREIEERIRQERARRRQIRLRRYSITTPYLPWGWCKYRVYLTIGDDPERFIGHEERRYS